MSLAIVGSTGRWKIGGRTLSVSNLDKPLYANGFTKRRVLEYYKIVAPAMLGHLSGRAVTLKRYPNGADAPFFFEKNCPEHRPAWIATTEVKGRGGTVRHCMLNKAADLLWAANLASLELHVPLAKASSPGRPTVVAFDLDPGAPANIRLCATIGLRLRDTLSGLGLQCFAKSSGGKGLHIYLPLNTGGVTFDNTREFARSVAQLFARDDPKHVTATMTRSLRTGKVLVDWSQNDPHKTTACVYTLRAGRRPGVSTPLNWEEVSEAAHGKTALRFSPRQVVDRIDQFGDLFEPVRQLRQHLRVDHAS